MPRRGDALRHDGDPFMQSFKVDQSCEEGSHLYICSIHKTDNEVFQWYDARRGRVSLIIKRRLVLDWRWRLETCRISLALNTYYFAYLASNVGNHRSRYTFPDEMNKMRAMREYGEKGSGMASMREIRHGIRIVL